MRFQSLLRAASLCALFASLAFTAAAQDQNGDVAAAARKAREQQQKNAQKPAKVLTNDDIPSVILPTDNAPAADANAAKGEAKGETKGEGKGETKKSAATGKEEPKPDPNGEEAWRGRFQELHDKIATTQQELDVLQRELDKNQVQYYSDPQKAMTQQYDRSDINDKTAKIDAKKKELDALNQQLSDLQDQLRKSGGNPGWAR